VTVVSEERPARASSGATTVGVNDLISAWGPEESNVAGLSAIPKSLGDIGREWQVDGLSGEGDPGRDWVFGVDSWLREAWPGRNCDRKGLRIPAGT